MSKELTPWFPASIDPVRPGTYQVHRYGVNEAYPARTVLEWTGASWRHTEDSAIDLINHRADMSGKDKWRGLAADPKEQS
jgi:hypothetical protein